MERPLARYRRALSIVAAVAVAGLAPIGASAASDAIGLDPAGVPAASFAPASSGVADAALAWLGGELSANGDAMPGFANTIDWGLSADAILAFTAAGRGGEPTPSATLDRLAANVAAYTTWDAAMPGSDVRLAGPTAKTLLALSANGRGSVLGALDLEAELRSLMDTGGAQRGRFSDRVPNPAWNGANGFGQALAVAALEFTAGGAPAESVSFLIDQQCPSGGFRLDYGATAGCDDDAEADTDASALALSALLAVERTGEVGAALTAGIDWLIQRQNPDGSFQGTGPTAAPNANGAGTAAQALRAAGYTAHADAAAAWIERCCVAAATGAIAYNADGLAGGFTPQTADQWRRSTAQAVLAFGLAPYGPAVAPLVTTAPPVTTAAPTTAAPTTAAPTTTVTTTVATTAPTTAAPTATTPGPAAPSVAAPGAASPATDTVAGNGVLDASLSRNGGVSGGSGGAQSGESLAATGTTTASTLAAGLGLFAAGAALLGGRRLGRALRRS